ncbi:hypothetical protein [Dactylosporangium darangshiense]
MSRDPANATAPTTISASVPMSATTSMGEPRRCWGVCSSKPP